jgi:hypothetical protein
MKNKILTSIFVMTQLITNTSISVIAKSSDVSRHKIGFTTRDASECSFWFSTDKGKAKQNIMAISRAGVYMNIDGSDIELRKITSKRTNKDGKTIKNNGVRTISIYKAGKFQIEDDITLVDSNWNFRGNIKVSTNNWSKTIKVHGLCDYFG